MRRRIPGSIRILRMLGSVANEDSYEQYYQSEHANRGDDRLALPCGNYIPEKPPDRWSRKKEEHDNASEDAEFRLEVIRNSHRKFPPKEQSERM